MQWVVTYRLLKSSSTKDRDLYDRHINIYGPQKRNGTTRYHCDTDLCDIAVHTVQELGPRTKQHVWFDRMGSSKLHLQHREDRAQDGTI